LVSPLTKPVANARKNPTASGTASANVVGPDGLSRFDELRRREAAQTAILYAFDLIEHDGEDLRDRPFLDRKAALARLLRDTDAGILLNEAVAAPQRKSLGKGPWLSTMLSLITAVVRGVLPCQ